MQTSWWCPDPPDTSKGSSEGARWGWHPFLFIDGTSALSLEALLFHMGWESALFQVVYVLSTEEWFTIITYSLFQLRVDPSDGKATALFPILFPLFSVSALVTNLLYNEGLNKSLTQPITEALIFWLLEIVILSFIKSETNHCPRL